MMMNTEKKKKTKSLVYVKMEIFINLLLQHTEDERNELMVEQLCYVEKDLHTRRASSRVSS